GDLALAAEAADAMLANGADVLTGTAQMVPGAIQKASEEDALWFGTQANQTDLAPEIVVANQVYDWIVVLEDIINRVLAGELGGEAYAITLENGGLRIEYNDAYELPEDVRAAADDAAAAISAGEIDVMAAIDEAMGEPAEATEEEAAEEEMTEEATEEAAAEEEAAEEEMTEEAMAEDEGVTPLPLAIDLPEGETFRVAVVMPSTSTDLAFSQSMADSLAIIQDALGEDRFEYAVSENIFVVEDAATAIRDYATQDFDLVIAHGSQYGSSLEEIAPDFPETAFAWGTTVNTFVDEGITNVYAYEARSEEGG